MEAQAQSQPRLVSVPSVRLPRVEPGHKRLAFAYSVVMLALVLVAVALSGLTTTWSPPILLAVLITLTFIGTELRIWVRPNFSIDSTLPVFVIAALILGPLAAMAIEIGPRLSSTLTRRNRPSSLAVNFAGPGWGALAAIATFNVLGGESAGPAIVGLAVAAASIAFLLVDYAVAAPWAMLRDRDRPVTMLVDEMLGYLPVFGVLSILTGACYIGYSMFGYVALLVLVPIVALPAARFPYYRMRRLPEQQNIDELRREYALEMAAVLTLTRQERRNVSDACALLSNGPKTTQPDHLAQVLEIAFLASDALGSSTGSRPLESRIVRVADRWAQLTAADGDTLPQRTALINLRTQTPATLDPDAVAAAELIVQRRRLPHRPPQRTPVDTIPQTA